MRKSRGWPNLARVGESWRAVDRASKLRLEPLEARALLSASSVLDGIFAEAALHAAAVTNPTPRGYTPAQIRAAYGVDQIAFGGITGNGSGQTIAIVDAYDDPNIASDLHTFDQTFGIADPPSFTKLNQNGGTSLPAANAGWSEEIALDVEWAHALAPGANILLVEANSSSLTDLLAAVDVARRASGVSVVSMSWGSSEFIGEAQYDSHFTTPAGHTPVTFFASAGDSGAGASWPAASPNVVSVGGTSLSVAGGNYASESAWSGSGGGYSQVEAEPSVQNGVQSSRARSIPDVAFVANPNTGVAVYDTVATGGATGWFQIGGTSAGAPQWAALFAIANQGRALTGQASLPGGLSSVYNLPGADFHDVTSGSNGYTAGAGYDLVTGRGTPIANAVVRDLVGNTTSTVAVSTPATPAPTKTTPAPQHHRYYYYQLVYSNGHWTLTRVLTNAVDSSNSIDSVNQSVTQVATALASGAHASTLATAATSSTIPPVNLVELARISAAQPTVPAGALLAVAPQSGRGTGNVATALDQAELPQADPNVEPGAAGQGDAQSTCVLPGQSVDNLNSNAVDLLPQAGSPLLGSALDLCFAGGAWALPLADAPLSDVLTRATDQVVRSWDLDLAVAAAGVAMTAHFAKKDSETGPCRAYKPRRQLCRLDRK